MKNHFGKCALCGKECELTFEHIPPRAAFNSTPAKPVSGAALFEEKLDNGEERMPWDMEGLPYQNQQKGMGKYSLCKECNNNTGSWYGDAYITFARIAHFAIQNYKEDNLSSIGFKEMYPLRIMKQILSMFCSVNSFGDARLEPLKKFVLNKDAVCLDKTKYKLCMYFTASNLMKYADLSVILKITDVGPESIALSEITTYPFGFILYFNPTETWNYEGIDITGFSDFGYDKMVTVEMPWAIEEMNDIFPEHYRSKEEIKKCIEENRKWSEVHDDM